ncbi:hypothetical protein [Flagellimonas sp. 2504JD1-5]
MITIDNPSKTIPKNLYFEKKDSTECKITDDLRIPHHKNAFLVLNLS